MTIAEKERAFVDRLNELEDWMFQYDYLLMQTIDMPVLEKGQRADEYLVKGCQSKVWIRVSGTWECVSIKGESLSMIVKGMLAVLISILDQQPAEDILKYEIQFLDQTQLGKQISADRLMGLSAMLEHIKIGIKNNTTMPERKNKNEN